MFQISLACPPLLSFPGGRPPKPAKKEAAVQPLTIQRHVAIHDIHTHLPGALGWCTVPRIFCLPLFVLQSRGLWTVNGYRTGGLWARGSCSSGLSGPSTPALPGLLDLIRSDQKESGTIG